MTDVTIRRSGAKGTRVPISPKTNISNLIVPEDESCLGTPEEIARDNAAWDRQCDIDQFAIMPITYAASIGSVLNKSKMWILANFAECVKSLVARQGIAVTQILVSGFCDPDDGETQVVVSVHTDEFVDIAMQAWKSVDICIEEWLGNQPEQVKDVVLEQFTTDFTWKSAPISV